MRSASDTVLYKERLSASEQQTAMMNWLDVASLGMGAGVARLESSVSKGVPNKLEPEFEIFYRGDATDRSRYLSRVAENEGVDASNALLAKAENSGTVSALFDNHGIGSATSPFVGVSPAEEVGVHFARGLAGDQLGYVSVFKLPKGLAQPNFENRIPWEREWVVPTEIDTKYLLYKYQVAPKP